MGAGRPTVPKSERKKSTKRGIVTYPDVDALYKKHRYSGESYTNFLNRSVRERFQKD